MNLETITISNGTLEKDVFKIPAGADLETVLQCIEYFCQIGKQLDFEADDFLDKLEEIMQEQDLIRFQQAQKAQGIHIKTTITKEDFVECMKQFALHYNKSRNSSNTNNNGNERKSWGPLRTWWRSPSGEDCDEDKRLDMKELTSLLSCDATEVSDELEQ